LLVEILERCECGLLVEPRDPSQIAEQTKKILRDKELWQRFSENGAAQVKNAAKTLSGARFAPYFL